MSLDDTAVLVTGASSGIGKATAAELAARGADVAISARRRERLEILADELRAAHDVDVLVHPADVREESDVVELVATAADRFDGLETVVANAGLARQGAVEEMEVDRFDQMLEVNCRGAFLTAREALPHLRESEGVVVFVGSMAGQYPRPFNPIYAATKWWVRGFAKSLAGSVGGDDVGVSVVNPTEVRTEFNSEDGDPFAETLDPGEVSEPEDIARAIAFAAEQEPPNTVQELDLYRRDKFEGW